jgi:hypothetical protein
VLSRQVGLVRGTRWTARSSAGRMVAEQQDEVMNNFFIESQNQGRPGTSWEPSHEWRLAGGYYTKSAEFVVVHHKLTGFLG